MTGFIVYGTPRSRTFWLSRYLSVGEWSVGHDEARRARSLDDVRAWLGMEWTGTVETAAAPFWRLVHGMKPDLRSVTVRRPIPEIMDSLYRLNLTFDPARMERMLWGIERKLDQIEARVPGVLAVTFADLGTEAGCARVFEHCLGFAPPPGWWGMMDPLNIQENVRAILRYHVANDPQIKKCAALARQKIIQTMPRPRVVADGFTFQQEPFEIFYRDGKHLFAEHLAQIGENPDAYARKNLTLMKNMNDAGTLQITTARSNGKMFGYLMAIIYPDMDRENVLQAVHTKVFASSNAPGLGGKLQSASIKALKAKNISDLFMTAGQDDGKDRIGVLYRRAGASRVGEIYKLGLMEMSHNA